MPASVINDVKAGPFKKIKAQEKLQESAICGLSGSILTDGKVRYIR